MQSGFFNTQDEVPLRQCRGAHHREASLGTLVRFEQSSKRSLVPPKLEGSARIVLFTGVRYERFVPPVELADPSRPKRKRG